MAKYMTKTEYLKNIRGKKVDVDGVPQNQPYQCVDLVKDFWKKCYGITFSFSLPDKNPHGYAKSLWENFNDYPELQGKAVRIKNTASFTPQEGDVVVWRGGRNMESGVGIAGHVAVATGKNTGTVRFKSLDQNWGGKYYVAEVDHRYTDIYGVVRMLLKCTKADLNVRTGPGVKYSIVQKNGEDFVLPKGTVFKPKAYQNGWAKYGEGQWVSEKYLD